MEEAVVEKPHVVAAWEKADLARLVALGTLILAAWGGCCSGLGPVNMFIDLGGFLATLMAGRWFIVPFLMGVVLRIFFFYCQDNVVDLDGSNTIVQVLFTAGLVILAALLLLIRKFIRKKRGKAVLMISGAPRRLWLFGCACMLVMPVFEPQLSVRGSNFSAFWAIAGLIALGLVVTGRLWAYGQRRAAIANHIFWVSQAFLLANNCGWRSGACGFFVWHQGY